MTLTFDQDGTALDDADETTELDDELVVRRGAALVPRPTKFRDKDAGREVRRGLPIHGYFGRNGMGKSLAMIHDTLPDLYAGDPVLSTVALLDAETGEPYPNYTRLTDWDQVMSFERGAILFDEIVGIAGARASMSLPVQVQNHLNKLRKADIALRWTAPAWARADLIIRETSQGATLCKGYWGKKVRDDSGRLMTWRQRRLFRWKTYDATDFEEWSATKEGKLKTVPGGKAWYSIKESRAAWSYDTYGDVALVGMTLESGRCASCGGTRRTPECSCANYVASKTPRRSPVAIGSRPSV